MYVAAFLILVLQYFAGAFANEVHPAMTAPSGDFALVDSGHHEFKIRVAKNHKIALSINPTLSENGFLKIRDGIGGVDNIYIMIGDTVFMRKEDSQAWHEQDSLPIVITTVTRKMVIRYYGGTGEDRFTAHYTSFNDAQGCRKIDVELKEGSVLSGMTCDVDELSPVASQCNVTLDCGTDYTQYNKVKTCNGGEWFGNVNCQPIRERLQECSYDFDNVTANETSSCPYSAAEVARYYIDVEEVAAGTETLERSGQQQINCRWVCARNKDGTNRVNCARPTNQGQYVRCVVCRMIYLCQRGVCFF